MTSRERFHGILRGDDVDRLPALAVEPYEPDGIERWRAEGLPAGVAPEDTLGMDRLIHLPVSLFPQPAFETPVLAEDEESYTTIDFMGPVVRRLKRAPSLYYGYLRYPVTDLRSWREYSSRFRPTAQDRLPSVPEDANYGCSDTRIRREAVIAHACSSTAPIGINIFPFFFRLGFYALGMKNFMLAFYDQPDLVHEMFSFWSRFVIDTLSLVLPDAQVDFVAFNEDLAYKNGTHVSREIYERFWLPHQDPVVEALHNWGVENVCMWSAGNLTSLLPTLLDHGFTMIWPLERAAGMDPYSVRREYGTSLRLCGGFAKESLIEGRQAVDAELGYLLPLARDGGFIPALDDMVPLEVSFADYRYYVNQLLAARP
jgi:uroporphyrinogen decarboxylase